MRLVRKKVRISSSVTRRLKEDIRYFADKRNVSMSKYTEQAIKDKVARDRQAFKKLNNEKIIRNTGRNIVCKTNN